jgi:hypothetical protein
MITSGIERSIRNAMRAIANGESSTAVGELGACLGRLERQREELAKLTEGMGPDGRQAELREESFTPVDVPLHDGRVMATTEVKATIDAYVDSGAFDAAVERAVPRNRQLPNGWGCATIFEVMSSPNPRTGSPYVEKVVIHSPSGVRTECRDDEDRYAKLLADRDSLLEQLMASNTLVGNYRDRADELLGQLKAVEAARDAERDAAAREQKAHANYHVGAVEPSAVVVGSPHGMVAFRAFRPVDAQEAVRLLNKADDELARERAENLNLRAKAARDAVVAPVIDKVAEWNEAMAPGHFETRGLGSAPAPLVGWVVDEVNSEDARERGFKPGQMAVRPDLPDDSWWASGNFGEVKISPFPHGGDLIRTPEIYGGLADDGRWFASFIRYDQASGQSIRNEGIWLRRVELPIAKGDTVKMVRATAPEPRKTAVDVDALADRLFYDVVAGRLAASAPWDSYGEWIEGGGATCGAGLKPTLETCRKAAELIIAAGYGKGGAA